VAWEVEYTDQFETWWEGQSEESQERIDVMIAELAARGPALGRPCVDTVKGSKFPNMKELRVVGTSIRILFAFDPRRVALLLLGGDKAGQWKEWYDQAIPEADELFDQHLVEVKREADKKDG
jgi:hypothetical protein